MLTIPGAARLLGRPLLIPTLALVFIQPAAAAAPTRRARERPPIAVLVLAPDLGFPQFALTQTPALTKLAHAGAVGMMNTRTVHAESLDEACLTIGAGSRANVSFPGEIGQSFDRDETFDGASAADVYRRRTALNPQRYQILALNYAQIKADSSVEDYDLEPGLLGDTLRDAHVRSAALGNADLPGAAPAAPFMYHREVAGVVMDHLGRVFAGAVSERLLTRDPGSPFSVRLNVPQTVKEFRSLTRRCRFIAIEDGDLLGIQETEASFTGPAFRAQQARALRRLDTLVGDIAVTMDCRRDLLIVCSPVTQGPAAASSTLAPIIAVGPEMQGGWLSSNATRRVGLVTITDLAPTILQFFGAPQPTAMLGSPMRAVPADRHWGAGPLWNLGASGDPIQSVTHLAASVSRLDSQRIAVERWLIYLCQWLLLIAAIAYAWRAVNRLRLAEWGFLFPLALPLALLIQPFLPHPVNAISALEALLLSGLLIVVAIAIGRRGRGPIIILAILNSIAIIADLLTGQQGMISSMIGYSPSEGARYYGIGNEYMGVLVGAADAACCLCAGKGAGRRVAAGLALFIPAILICLPSVGAKAGGALVAVPTAALAAWLLLGGRFSWKLLLSIAVLGILALSFMVLRDLHNPQHMSHVGKAMNSVLRDGPHAAGAIIARKTLMEWRLVKYSPWSRCLIAAIIAAIILYFARRSAWKTMISDRRVYAALSALVCAAITSLLFNDAGVIAAALSFVYFPAIAAACLPDPMAPVPSNGQSSLTTEESSPQTSVN